MKKKLGKLKGRDETNNIFKLYDLIYRKRPGSVDYTKTNKRVEQNFQIKVQFKTKSK